MQRRELLSLLAAGSALGGGVVNAADAYPSKPIRWIVPYTPGGGTDAVARIVADQVSKILGQPIVVENKPGGGGVVAYGEVIRSKPDGYTATVGTGNRTTLNIMNDRIAFNVAAELISIAPLANVPIALIASNALAVSTVEQLINYARLNPGLRYGTPGATTPHHLAGVQLGSMMGVELIHVGYKGTAPLIQDILGGHLPLAIVGLSTALQYVDGIQLKVLGMGGERRSELAPTIPTIAEGGVKGYSASYWYDITVSKNFPGYAIDIMGRAISTAMRSKEVVERLLRSGFEPMLMNRDEYSQLLRREHAKLERLIKLNGIRVD